MTGGRLQRLDCRCCTAHTHACEVHCPDPPHPHLDLRRRLLHCVLERVALLCDLRQLLGRLEGGATVECFKASAGLPAGVCVTLQHAGTRHASASARTLSRAASAARFFWRSPSYALPFFWLYSCSSFSAFAAAALAAAAAAASALPGAALSSSCALASWPCASAWGGVGGKGVQCQGLRPSMC